MKANVIPGVATTSCYPRLDVFVGKRDDILVRLLQAYGHIVRCRNTSSPNVLAIIHLAKTWDPKHSIVEQCKIEFSLLCNEKPRCRIFILRKDGKAERFAPT